MNRHPAEFDAVLAALVSEHAPHGFAGFMRSAKDGCQVYVAAAALRDALRECVTQPDGGCTPCRTCGGDQSRGWHLHDRPLPPGCTPYCDGPCSAACQERLP